MYISVLIEEEISLTDIESRSGGNSLKTKIVNWKDKCLDSSTILLLRMQ